MAVITGTNIGLKYNYVAGDSGWGVGSYNPLVKALEGVVHALSLDMTLTAPLGGDLEGDTYVPASGASGAWSGKANQLAVRQNGAWVFYPPRYGWRLYDINFDRFLYWDGVSWNSESRSITNQKFSDYTLDPSDSGRKVVFNAGSDVNVTVPAGLGDYFDCLIVQLGAGQVTFVADGATLQNRSSYTKTAGQYAVMSLVAVGSDTLIIAGDGA